jgi:hypothetical protein
MVTISEIVADGHWDIRTPQDLYDVLSYMRNHGWRYATTTDNSGVTLDELQSMVQRVKRNLTMCGGFYSPDGVNVVYVGRHPHPLTQR